MDGRFSQQLADLRRAASRAGRDGAGGRGRRGGGGREGGGRGAAGGRDGRDGGRGGHGGRDGHGSNNYGRRDDDSDRGEGRGDCRGGGGSSYHGGGRRDGRRGRYEDRYEDRRHDGGRDRKRGRYDGYDGRHGRDHRRGAGRDRGGGRAGGRWDGASRPDHRRRNDSGEDGQRSAAPLSELVEKVAQKYQASQVERAAAASDGKAGTKKQRSPKRRHIALLFLTIDDLPHERVWREWLKSGADDYLKEAGDDKRGEAGGGKNRNDGSTSHDNVLVSVLCHAKYPERIQSPWLRRRHLLRPPNGDGGNGATKEGGTDGNDPNFLTHRPGWGSVEITRAMLDLLEEGLRIGGAEGKAEGRDGGGAECVGRRYLSTPGDVLPADNGTDADAAEEAKPSSEDANECTVPPVDRFVFVSESCLPVTTLKEMEMALFGPKPQNGANGTSQGESQPQSKNVESLYNKSWVNARSTPNNGYAKQLQWDAVRPSDVPSRLLWKADQWLVLTRTHGEAIASLPHTYLEGRPLWPAFQKCRASDEMYFPTALAILGVVHRPSNGMEVDDPSAKESCAGDEVRRRKVTYCDWSVGAKNPASFTAAGWRAVVEKARGEGCLLARKFVSEASMPGGRKGGGGGGKDDGLVSVADWIAAVAKRGST